MATIQTAERLRRGARGATMVGSMPKDRIEIDETKYSGRVAARIRKLVDENDVPIKALAAAVGASERTVLAYLSNTRTIHPDLYPAFAKVLKVKLADMLPGK